MSTSCSGKSLRVIYLFLYIDDVSYFSQTLASGIQCRGSVQMDWECEMHWRGRFHCTVVGEGESASD